MPGKTIGGGYPNGLATTTENDILTGLSGGSIWDLITEERLGGDDSDRYTFRVDARELLRALARAEYLWTPDTETAALARAAESHALAFDEGSEGYSLTVRDFARAILAGELHARPRRSLTPIGGGITSELAAAVTVSTTVGTLTARSVVTGATWVERQPRNAVVTATTANAHAARSLTQPVMCGEAGFDFQIVFAPTGTPAASGGKLFVGLAGAAGTLYSGSAEPSTLTNVIGLGYDSNDTRVQLFHNDGSGTCTKVDVGGGVMMDRADGLPLRLRLFGRVVSGSLVVAYEVERIGDATRMRGEITTNLPASTQTLTPSMQCTTTAAGGAAAAIDFCGLTFVVRGD